MPNTAVCLIMNGYVIHSEILPKFNYAFEINTWNLITYVCDLKSSFTMTSIFQCCLSAFSTSMYVHEQFISGATYS